MLEQLEGIFLNIIRYGILVLEAIGAILIVYYALRSVVWLLRRDPRRSHHEMTRGITTGLSYMLGSEVLKTLIAPDWTDIGMTCAILLMRAGINVLVHWENSHETEESFEPLLIPTNRPNPAEPGKSPESR